MAAGAGELLIWLTKEACGQEGCNQTSSLGDHPLPSILGPSLGLKHSAQPSLAAILARARSCGGQCRAGTPVPTDEAGAAEGPAEGERGR